MEIPQNSFIFVLESLPESRQPERADDAVKAGIAPIKPLA